MEVVGNNGRLVSKFILIPPLCVCALMHVCIHTLCVRTYIVCARVCVQTLQGPSALARSHNCRWVRRLSSVRSFAEAVSNQNESFCVCFKS